MRRLAEQIRAHHAFCRDNPDRARRMGEEARRIFETHFAAERMLANACANHQRKTAARDQARALLGEAPAITVVVRCGGRSLETLGRAIDSIRRQSFGRFTVILAKYRDLNLSDTIAAAGGAIVSFDEFLIEGGGRAEMLFAALRRVATPYFAVLDDDDFWLDEHIEELFRAGRRADPDFDMAFSGVVDFDHSVRFSENLFFERNIGRFGFDKPLRHAHDIQDAIHLSCFVARSDLLTPELLNAPAMRTAEDSLLICPLARRKQPVFSWKATAFYRRDPPDGSGWQNDPQPTEDTVSLGLRAGLGYAPSWLGASSFAMLDHVWADARKTIGATILGEHLHRLIVGRSGWRVPRGITCSGESAGFLAHGPYVRLPEGSYSATFLVVPDADAAGDTLGDGTVGAMPPGITLVGAAVERNSTEIVLRFAVTADMSDWRFEFPISCSGAGSFTVASVALNLGGDDAVSAAAPVRRHGSPPGGDPRPVAALPPNGDSAQAAALRSEIEDLRRSTSWRVTAPLRAVSRLFRRIAG